MVITQIDSTPNRSQKEGKINIIHLYFIPRLNGVESMSHHFKKFPPVLNVPLSVNKKTS